jgi:hypothetical protein
LIFTEKTFKSLKRELSRFTEKKPRKLKPKICVAAPPSHVKKQRISKRITHAYEPSNIWPAYDSDRWRWRRFKEWFNQCNQDNQSKTTLQHILRSYQAMPEVYLEGDRRSMGL